MLFDQKTSWEKILQITDVFYKGIDYTIKSNDLNNMAQRRIIIIIEL